MERDLDWAARAVRGKLLPPGAGKVQIDLALVVTDSREAVPGSTYVARVGEESDGHDYAAQAIENGAVCVIVERPLPLGGTPQLVVAEGTRALGDLARAHLEALRSEGEITVIGITGSAGKTTTKDLLGHGLSRFAPTVWPKLSYNNEVGCPITILKAGEKTRYLVLEMGASARGELAYLTKIAPLDIALVLMVGRAHLGGFGGEKALARAKSELVEGVVPGGVSVLNMDDPATRAMASLAPGPVLEFSAQGNTSANLWAEDIRFDSSQRARFQMVQLGASEPVQLSLVGQHQVSNALAAALVMIAAGFSLKDAAQSVGGAGPASPHRMDVRELELKSGLPRRFRLVDDSYNANPDSMGAAFKAARALAGSGRLLMVLGQMLELGEESETIHAEVGADALNAAPEAVLILRGGESYIPSFPQAAAGQTTVEVAADPAEALRLLEELLSAGDTVLVKGSNGSGAWQVADGLVERSEDAKEAAET